MIRILAWALLAALVVGGCGADEAAERARQAEIAAQAAQAERARRAYEASVNEARLARETSLQRPQGWLSLVGLHWLQTGTTFVGSAPHMGVQLAVGPAEIGKLSLDKEGVLTFSAARDAGVTIDDQPAAGPVRLVADTEGKPTVVGFNKGDASFIVIQRGGRYALRVRDALAPSRLNFPGLDYFAIDPAFKLTAKFEAHPPGKTIEIANIIGILEATPNPGVLVFEKDGKTFRLEALDGGDGALFLVFADRTSGHDTYAAARFLDAPPVGKDGTTVLDFNLAYNPPCAFTTFATCPLPPPENRLDLAITAGEKKPRAEVH